MSVYPIDVTGPLYGAVGDADFDTGVGTDDTAAFEAARTTALITGGTIWIPANAPGKCYKLTREIAFSSGAQIEGEGKNAVVRQFGDDAHCFSTGTPTGLIPGTFIFRNFTVAANNDNDVTHKMDAIHLTNAVAPVLEDMYLTKGGQFNLYMFNCLRPRVVSCVAYAHRSVLAGADFHMDAGGGHCVFGFNHALSNCKLGFYLGLGSGTNTGVVMGNQAITMEDDGLTEITTIAGNLRYRAFSLDYNSGCTNRFEFIGNVGKNARWNGLALQGAGSSPVPGIHQVIANRFINCDMEVTGLNLGGSILIDNPADGLLVALNLIEAGESGCVGEAGVHVIDSNMVDNHVCMKHNRFMDMSVPALLGNFKHRNMSFTGNYVYVKNATYVVDIEPNYTPNSSEEWEIVINENTIKYRQHPDAVGKSVVRLRNIMGTQRKPRVTGNNVRGYTTSLDGSHATPADYNAFVSLDEADCFVEDNEVYHFKYGVVDLFYRTGVAGPFAMPQVNRNRFESVIYWTYLLGSTHANTLGRVFIGNTGDTGWEINGAGGYVHGIMSGQWMGNRYRFDGYSNTPPTNTQFPLGTIAANSRGVSGEPGEWTLTSSGWKPNWNVA